MGLTWIIILAVGLMLGGIFLLSRQAPLGSGNRDGMLKLIEKHVEGRLEPCEDAENSFQIKFSFEGINFIYEDCEAYGFNDKIYKTYLKAYTKSDLNLSFSERKQDNIMGSGVVMASEIKDIPRVQQSIELPKGLKEFQVNTNHPDWVRKILEIPRIVRILVAYKNMDQRGYRFNALKVINGVVILDFQSSQGCYPKPVAEEVEVDAIDQYILQLSTIAKIINEIGAGPKN